MGTVRCRRWKSSSGRRADRGRVGSTLYHRGCALRLLASRRPRPARSSEGFGGPYSGSSTDIGAAIIYAAVFLALLVVNARSETSRYSVDRLIERRWAWWHRVAEVGRPPAGGGDQ